MRPYILLLLFISSQPTIALSKCENSFQKTLAQNVKDVASSLGVVVAYKFSGEAITANGFFISSNQIIMPIALDKGSPVRFTLRTQEEGDGVVVYKDSKFSIIRTEQRYEDMETIPLGQFTNAVKPGATLYILAHSKKGELQASKVRLLSRKHINLMWYQADFDFLSSLMLQMSLPIAIENSKTSKNLMQNKRGGVVVDKNFRLVGVTKGDLIVREKKKRNFLSTLIPFYGFTRLGERRDVEGPNVKKRYTNSLLDIESIKDALHELRTEQPDKDHGVNFKN